MLMAPTVPPGVGLGCNSGHATARTTCSSVETMAMMLLRSLFFMLRASPPPHGDETARQESCHCVQCLLQARSYVPAHPRYPVHPNGDVVRTDCYPHWILVPTRDAVWKGSQHQVEEEWAQLASLGHPRADVPWAAGCPADLNSKGPASQERLHVIPEVPRDAHAVQRLQDGAGRGSVERHLHVEQQEDGFLEPGEVLFMVTGRQRSGLRGGVA
ncbi:uncharacterized protein LOC144169120 isoform X2 [Haemaphysalis longicornis]